MNALIKKIALIVCVVLSSGLILIACEAQRPEEVLLEGVIIVDGQESAYTIDPDTKVGTLLEEAGISLSAQDKVIPDINTFIREPGITIKVIRVTESFTVEEIIIPYAQQTIRNESLPEGETRLVQAGENGIQETTYRHTYEDGVEVSKTIFETTIIQEPKPEITMIGVQSPLQAIILPEPLAYLSGGNAWIMRDTTENRIPIITTGDLDGRIFSLSPDKNWLLYTRAETEDEETINTLWVINLDPDNPINIDLGARNIIHFADWHPLEEHRLAYSTVEPRETAPGWQANNDLVLLSFDPQEETFEEEIILESNAGGLYGWWGTDFLWSPTGELAFTRPDAVGIIDFENQTLTTLLEITPYNTREDWSWIPGISWDQAGEILLVSTHPAEKNLENPEDSVQFNLSALILEENLQIDIVNNSGMFAYPSSAPKSVPTSCNNKIAYLQAIFPEDSDDSRYYLVIMDADGSNKTRLFPDEGSPGLSPQQVQWNEPVESQQAAIGFIYQGNLWIFDLINGSAHQITGDGLTSKLDW